MMHLSLKVILIIIGGWSFGVQHTKSEETMKENQELVFSRVAATISLEVLSGHALIFEVTHCLI